MGMGRTEGERSFDEVAGELETHMASVRPIYRSSLIEKTKHHLGFKTELLMNKGKPAIVIVNIGTIVEGAVDDLHMVIKTLEEKAGFQILLV